jgi:hypothetical protein
MNRVWAKKQKAKVRLASKRAKLVSKGLRASIDAERVANDWINTHNGVGTPPATARLWARTHVFSDTKALANALDVIHIDAYLLGTDIGMSGIARARTNKAPTLKELQRAIGINWDTWKPGNRAASIVVNPPRGLSYLLDTVGVTVNGLNNTTLDRIGTILAAGLKEGVTPSDMAKQMQWEIDDLLDDPERALTIAQTETSRAVSIASRELYEESGVELVEWLVADPCDLCQENADVSPIGIGDTFPSGDTEPPAHPNCVCDIAPYVVDTRNIGADALSFILDGED